MSAAAALRKYLNLFETNVLFKQVAFNSSHVEQFWVKAGSRLVFTLQAWDVSPGAQVQITVKNGFDVDLPYQTVLILELTADGFQKKVLSDCHNAFEVEIAVIAGTASLALGVTPLDNALSTHIEVENAEIAVALSHIMDALGRYDSTRLGDGVRELKIRAVDAQDGSIDIFDIGHSKQARIARRVLVSPDVARAFTFAEIDGVRRVTKIEFTSASLDALLGATVKLTRDFTYQVADPFDLVSVNDTLTGV